MHATLNEALPHRIARKNFIAKPTLLFSVQGPNGREHRAKAMNEATDWLDTALPATRRHDGCLEV
jgi:hypothetical protein